MSVFILPCRSDSAHYGFTTELDGVSYGFEFRWNVRDAAWYMTVLTGEDEIIVTGVKVVVDLPLAVRCKDARMPPGRFLAYDTSGQQLNPGLTDLGERVQLSYLDSDEP